MTSLPRLACLAALLLLPLAATAQTESETPAPTTPTPANCADYPHEDLIGLPFAEMPQLPFGIGLRVFSPTNLVGTTDYLPNRLNITYDKEGIIRSAGCG